MISLGWTHYYLDYWAYCHEPSSDFHHFPRLFAVFASEMQFTEANTDDGFNSEKL